MLGAEKSREQPQTLAKIHKLRSLVPVLGLDDTVGDHYGAKELRSCCVLTETANGGQVQLDLPTFSGTAEMAARSRADD